MLFTLGLAITLFLIIFLVGVIDDKPPAAAVMATAWSFIITSIVCGALYILSYDSYLDLVNTKASISQYTQTIELYKENGLKEFRNTNRAPDALDYSGEMTDIKFSEYQKNMSEMIENLKYKVVNYNNIVSTKRAKLKGKIFNWLIYPPDDDMQCMDMQELVAKNKQL